MNPDTKKALTNILQALAEKAAVSAGSLLVGYQLLQPAQEHNFENIFVGFVLGLGGLAWNWYREAGHAKISVALDDAKAKLELLNQPTN